MPHLKDTLGITKFETAAVIHCADSFGVAIEHQDGWKIVFSGDTRPCPTMEEIGRGATLLIHEATFEDNLLEEAQHKSHSTTKEAIDSANAMGATFLMMTHFSQRYPKIPTFTTTSGGASAGIAFDLMRIRFSDFDIIPAISNVLQLLFAARPADESDDDEDLGSAT